MTENKINVSKQINRKIFITKQNWRMEMKDKLAREEEEGERKHVLFLVWHGGHF